MKIATTAVLLLITFLLPPALAASITPIDVPGSAKWSAAFGLNDASHVTGAYQSIDGSMRGYVFDGSNFTTFNAPNDGGYTVAHSINNAGAVAGIYGQSQLGFVYQNGQFQTIQPSGVPSVNGLTINNNGDLAGWWDDGGVVRGFIQTAAGDVSILDPTPFTRMYVAGLNDYGNISGRFDQANFDGIQPGFLGAPSSLQLLSYPNSRLTSITGNNNAGDGAGFYGQYGPWSAFAYVGGIFLDLVITDSTNATASDINNNSIVVGTYMTSTGVTRGFITTPVSAVPEPSTWLLTSVALAMLILRSILHRKRCDRQHQTTV